MRKIKARLVRRQGASVFRPIATSCGCCARVVLADNASWLFRVTPYITFAAIWVAAALVPTFATGLLFNWTADLIAIVALLGSARSSSRSRHGRRYQVWRHRLQPRGHDRALAEPAMLIVFVWRSSPARRNSRPSRIWRRTWARVSLGMALVALFMVAIAENARIPVDNPATHLELMVHEAMILECLGTPSRDDRIRRVPQAAATSR